MALAVCTDPAVSDTKRFSPDQTGGLKSGPLPINKAVSYESGFCIVFITFCAISKMVSTSSDCRFDAKRQGFAFLAHLWSG